MKESDEDSANLKRRLRTLAVTPALCVEAEDFPIETDEALDEVERGLMPALPQSFVVIGRATKEGKA